jgi:thiol:disulfide interchange protein
VSLVARTIAIIAVLWVAGSGFAQRQPNPVKWSTSTVPDTVKPGKTFVAIVQAEIEPGWHLYSMMPVENGPTATQVVVAGNQPFRSAGPVASSEAQMVFDPNFSIDVELYDFQATFRVPVAAEISASIGPQIVNIDVTYQTCNDHMCLPPRKISLPTAVTIVALKGAPSIASGTTVLPDITDKTKSGPARVPPPVGSTVPAQGGNREAPAVESSPRTFKAYGDAGERSLLSFLSLALAMGALSLLTPCVFPMVPITVSYFSNHTSGSRAGAIRIALLYGVGIVLTFTAAGVALALFFGAGGVNQLAANPWVNLLITAMFIAFALSLFGAYFFRIPAGFVNRVDALTRSRDGTHVAGALLMGFAFTLTSFTCTAPFVGTLLVMASQGNWHWPVVGMLTYSVVFALPFVILAAAPQFVSQLPRAGGWMNSVKVVMGFLEIAAAMKFLSNADLVWGWHIFTREVVLSVWIVLGALIVLYVCGILRFPHETRVRRIGLARIASAALFLVMTGALVPGLFGKRLGELDSFLPPSSADLAGNLHAEGAATGDVAWMLNDYDGALSTARRHGKLIFIDFTGYTCTNCRWMEANMFTRGAVQSELAKFVTVRLYTDGKGEIFERNQKMQQEMFGTVALPLYAIVDSTGKPVATFAGLTRKADEFVSFLRLKN